MLLTEEAGQQAEVINSQPAPESAPSVGASPGYSEDVGTSTNMASPSKGRSSRKSAAKKPDVFQAVMDFDADPYEPGAIEVRDQLDEANGIVRSVNTEESESEAANRRSMESSGSTDDRSMQSMGPLDEHSSEAGGIHVMDPHVVDEEAISVMPTVGERSWQWEVEDEEWQELAERLNPIHLEVLHALKVGSNRLGLQQIAEKAGSMPALLLDEINEAAMDTIGDLLIDGEAIADDYIDMLETLKSV